VVEREIEGAVARVRVTLPAVVTVTDKIVHPKSVQSKHTAAGHAYPDGVRFAALMAIMAAKKKPLVEMKLSDLATDTAPRVRYLKAELPPKRSAGVRVKDVKDLVARLKTEAKVIG
jgi:electron transfer flavoprotein beta subunit